ncbi:uncharacterized protein LOC121862884 [Homarus americanus]|uniref:uncharacterized protein LOC121862884 n=1 Tax=Homarus americanus TaxID=6706 RepID=UPI001C4867C5|nr:uncharacterized protein LOC121862884 [Homarus americanus]
MASLTDVNRLNFARYARFIFTLGQRTMLQAFHWLYKGGSMSLYDFLSSQSLELKGFFSSEKEKIKGGEDPLGMDITLLYKLLRRTCGLAEDDKAWIPTPESPQETSLEQALYQLKELRGGLGHPHPENFIKISDKKLDAQMKELRALYSKVLTLAGRKANQKKCVVESAISTMEEKFLQERYSESGITESEFLNMSYLELSLQHILIGKFDTSKYLEPRFMVENFKQVTDSPTVILLNDLLGQTCKDESRSQVIVVVGETGAGKTSLCQFMRSSWLFGQSTLQHLKGYQLVLGFHCSQINTRDVHYLLRTKILPYATSACDTAELTRFMARLKILWLVDGWDEATREAKSLLRELLEIQTTSHTVLIASRPELGAALSSDTFPMQEFLKVSLAGLNANERKELLFRNMPEIASQESERSIMRFIYDIGHFKEPMEKEMSNPLKLLLTAKLWLEDPKFEPNSSLTHLYKTNMDMQIKHLIKKLRDDASPAEDDAEQVINKWLRCFCKVAFNLVENGSLLRLDNKSIKQLRAGCSGFESSQFLSTFLEYHAEPGDSSGRGHYEFLHYSQQCFYAALHLDFTCSQAQEPDIKFNEIFQNYARESSDYIDPCLGIYDVFIDFLVLLMILVSRLSCGWVCSQMNRTDFHQKLQQLVRKLINLVRERCSPQNNRVPGTSKMNNYYPVLLKVLEMRAAGFFTAEISAKSLANMLFLSLDEDRNPTKWFEVLHSCRYQEDLVEEAALRVDTTKWNVTDGDLKASWEFFYHVFPKEIIITITSDPKRLSDLDIVLFAVARMNVKVHLHLNWHSRGYGLGDHSDTYLSLLCDNKPKCRMISFGGHLSSSSVQSLTGAPWMENLFIRVTDVKSINSLCSITQKLRRLQTLHLVYDLRSFIIPCSSLDGSFGILKFIDGTIGVLMQRGSRTLNVYLYLPNLKDCLVTKAVDFISGLNKHYTVLHVGHLDFKGVKKLIVGLNNNAVSVVNLVKPVYVKEINNYVQVQFGSLPLQIPLKELVEKWHDVSRKPLSLTFE